MLVDAIRGDILKFPHRHVAFAISADGYNDSGFAGLIADRYWPQLAHTAGKLGDVLTQRCEERMLHAIFCNDSGNWTEAPRYVEEGLNKIVAPENEIIAVVLIGGGPVGMSGGADVFAIIGGMARSNKRVVVYTL